MAQPLGVVSGLSSPEQVFESKLSGRFAKVLDCFEVVTTISGGCPKLTLYMIEHFLDEYFKSGAVASARFEFCRRTLELLPSNVLVELFARLGVTVRLRPELHMYRVAPNKDANTPTCRLEVSADGSVTFNGWSWLAPLGVS